MHGSDRVDRGPARRGRSGAAPGRVALGVARDDRACHRRRCAGVVRRSARVQREVPALMIRGSFAIDHLADTDASIPGLRLACHVLSEDEESELLRQIEHWSDGWERPVLREGLLPARREMRCFGWSYVTRGRTLTR